MEHIIPNALGGQLKTKKSTCALGHPVDTKLVQSLSFFAIALDVPRDRNQHPDFRFIDASNGTQYRIPPGSQPVATENMKVTRESDGKLLYNFYAPTKEKAERIFRKHAPKTRKFQTSEFVGTVVEGQRYHLKLSAFNIKDQALLCAIAKIALCFCREQNLVIPSMAISLRFLRGEATPFIPVAPARDFVINMEGSMTQPLTHGIYLCAMPSIKSLFCYVVLFEAFEFIVLIDDNYEGKSHVSGYRYCLITTRAESRDFRWTAPPEVLLDWIKLSQYECRYFEQKFLSLSYWLTHPERLWIERAVSHAANIFFAKLNTGSDTQQAEKVAWQEANKMLSKYNLRLNNFSIGSQ